MRILIVDDESSARVMLERKLDIYSGIIENIKHADSVKSALQVLSENEFDLIFLDIKMPDGTGFDLLEQMEERQVVVAFTTAHDEFALKAFEFAAIGYLLKPVDSVKLENVMQMARQMKQNRNPQYKLLVESYKEKKIRKLVIPNAEGFLIAEIGDIMYVKSDVNYSEFYFRDNKRKLISSKTLKEYSQILESEGFFRIHQSYLINMTYAREYKKAYNEVVLTDGTQLPVARQKKALFLSYFV